MRPNTQETADLIVFTKEFLNGKLHFFMHCYKMFDRVLDTTLTVRNYWKKFTG